MNDSVYLAGAVFHILSNDVLAKIWLLELQLMLLAYSFLLILVCCA